MSVLVRDMELPKSCSECKFYNDNCLLINKTNSDLEHRLDKCPLINIPESIEKSIGNMLQIYCLKRLINEIREDQ